VLNFQHSEVMKNLFFCYHSY